MAPPRPAEAATALEGASAAPPQRARSLQNRVVPRDVMTLKHVTEEYFGPIMHRFAFIEMPSRQIPSIR